LVPQIHTHRQTIEIGAKLASLMLFSGARCCELFRIQLFLQFSYRSASTSFVSRRIGPRGFARFDVGSLFFPELLCLFKVDLLIHCDCTIECVDHR